VVPVRDRNGETRDISLAVRASPFELEGERFTVFCITDISLQKMHAGLERTFLHDLSNLVTALAATSEALRHDPNTKANPIVNDMCDLTQRLSREIVIQRLLLSREPAKYRLNIQHASIAGALAFLERLFANHPVALTKSLSIARRLLVDDCVTDSSLLERILTNMLTNAFEATHDGREVRLAAESSETRMRFSVWNAECMTEAVASRVFQRHFSTKKGLGRGQGTYAIRLFGETLLRGQVGFASRPEDGTTFFVDLPRVAQSAVDRGRVRATFSRS
jgi:signal transduction histidine kinase